MYMQLYVHYMYLVLEPHVWRNLDSTVTVCRDFLRSGCSREKCRYFHPKSNLLAHFEPSAMPAMMQQVRLWADEVRLCT